MQPLIYDIRIRPTINLHCLNNQIKFDSVGAGNLCFSLEGGK